MMDDDEESLFGTPPSSPVRGRSPSLALPSSSNGISLLSQNVGTIALPGSQYFSELPMNPLALSLSLPHRPPACDVTRHPPPPPSTATSPSVSRDSSVAPPFASRKARQRKKSSAVATPRPPPPEIPLPDPSQPPPPNFLRSQVALLGTAGLVSKVIPATLTHNTWGKTATNPIIVEDETPKIGRTSYQLQLPSDIPVPTNEEIVQTLVRQKDIYPVLESILKLVASGSLGASSFSGSQRGSSEEPPAKKRKLRAVPAGAADWDVPYPFKEGEGPQKYETNWEKKRGKQLISQLVGLIKTATRIAALKKWGPGRHYRADYAPKPVSPGKDAMDVDSVQPVRRNTNVLTDNSNGGSRPEVPWEPTSDIFQSSSPVPELSAELNDLLTSLLETSNQDSSVLGGDVSADNMLDPAVFDSWLSILQSFPVQPDSTASEPNGGDPYAFLSAPEFNAPLPNFSDTPLDQAMNSVAFDNEFSSNSAIVAPDESQDFTSLFSMAPSFSASNNASEIWSNNISAASSSAPSPVPPFTLLGEPHNTNWEPPPLSSNASFNVGSFGQLQIPGDASHPVRGPLGLDTGKKKEGIRPYRPMVNPSLPSTSQPGPTAPELVEGAVAVEKQVNETITRPVVSSREIPRSVNPNFGQLPPPASTAVQGLVVEKGKPRKAAPPARGAARPATKAMASTSKATTEGGVGRDAILKRARERRRQIAEAIVAARLEVWETTLEQGVLAHLAKHYN
ncbi:hypothetical protein C8J56DRAFT_490864 [Mycena floridula]|nr:hypothetical protein C8J56DRAFT_490864 [Mycena floridula]